MRSELTRELSEYIPFNEQESRDLPLILSRLREDPDVFERRDLAAHMTASAWVTDPSRSRVLMCYHRQYDSWSWLGGHADGEEDLASVALREVREESGLTRLSLASPKIFSLEILPVSGHEKRGVYVSSHLHLNLTWLVFADPKDPLTVRPEENSGLRWFTLEEAETVPREVWMRERVYAKLNARLKAFPDR